MTDEERAAMIEQTVKNVHATCAAIKETLLELKFQDVEFQKKGYKVKNGLSLVKGGEKMNATDIKKKDRFDESRRVKWIDMNFCELL